MEHAWIVFKDEEVEAVLASPSFNARPPGELVPQAMQGTVLGDVFERLVRMNDGTRHDTLRQLVEERLARWDLNEVRMAAERAASLVARDDVAALTMASLLELRDPENCVPLIRDFANAVAAGAGADAVARGVAAVEPLLDAMPPCGDFDNAANALGFLFQSYAATARLIANKVGGRTDPPVLLTRRYAIQDTNLFGAFVRRGDAVIVLLTSPAYHFGTGRHACPGRRIAETIAGAAAPIIAHASR